MSKTETQSEALRLAAKLRGEAENSIVKYSTAHLAAKELERLEAENKALREVLQGEGAGLFWVITDCRFQNEAAMVRELGGQIWQVTRPGVSAGATGHVSDTDGSQFAPDRVIDNHGSLKTLQLALRDVMREQAFAGDAA